MASISKIKTKNRVFDEDNDTETVLVNGEFGLHRVDLFDML